MRNRRHNKSQCGQSKDRIDGKVSFERQDHDAVSPLLDG